MRKAFQSLPVLLPPLLALAACVGGSDRSAPSSRQERRPSPPSASISPAFRQCLAVLSGEGARFQPRADRYYGAGCSAVNSVDLFSLSTDTSRAVGLSNLGPVTCRLATQVAGWARYGVDRAARQILGSPLARIETFGSYNCRNIAGSTKRSGHATANAVDVSGFVLADGRRITVQDDWDHGTPAERNFLRVVHQSACKRFNTVLGPAYNAAHADHFHLEAAQGQFCR